VAHLVPIEDPGDPRLAGYRDVRDADLAGRAGRFMAEGEVVLRAAVRAGRHGFESLLLAEKRVPALADVIAALPGATPAYVAPQQVMDTVTGFPIHRGVLGLGVRAPEPEPEAVLAALPERALVLALVGIGNHDNLGGLFRNAAAFGVNAVLLQDCGDPLYRKAIRVSVGAALITPYARVAREHDLVALLERHGVQPIALSPAGATRLIDLERPPRAALLLGSEGPGLPDAVLARARTVSIPMAAGFDSLNVATTAGIALHQLVFG
jgi:tRNA G18 (ribose-2'-O)-methylase SpoU